MELLHLIYDDHVTAVGLVRSPERPRAECFAIRYLEPRPYTKDGQLVEMTNLMGGETDWFIIPRTMGAAIGRTLIEQKVAGLTGFQEEGFAALVQWLIKDEELRDAMCY